MMSSRPLRWRWRSIGEGACIPQQNGVHHIHRRRRNEGNFLNSPNPEIFCELLVPPLYEKARSSGFQNGKFFLHTVRQVVGGRRRRIDSWGFAAKWFYALCIFEIPLARGQACVSETFAICGPVLQDKQVRWWIGWRESRHSSISTSVWTVL